jgi:CelD/BcsL family acetyltransferase involved in cellulose biosynthesis
MSIGGLPRTHEAPGLPGSARAGGGGVRAEDVRTLSALEGLEPEWQRLWKHAPGATPFQSPQWLLPWWRRLGRGALATVALRCAASGRLVALAPLYAHTDAVTARRHLFPLGIATTDYLDWLVLPGWEEPALGCLAAHLAHSADPWDLLEWPELRPGSALAGLKAAQGWRCEVAEAEPHPVLMLERSRAHGAPAIRPRMAAKLRYGRRRAARAGTLVYGRAQANSIAGMFEALVRLHGRRWSLRGLPGVLDDECVLAWHREAAPRLLESGLLRLWDLRLDGEPIAVLYCLADTQQGHARRCYYYLGGFEPRWRALSPGTLLVGYAIEQAMDEGLDAFDFLRGGEGYKYRWGAANEAMCSLRAWHPSSREGGAP